MNYFQNPIFFIKKKIKSRLGDGGRRWRIMIFQAGLVLEKHMLPKFGQHVRGALFTFIFVSPYVPQGARRSLSSLSMASASNVLGATPGWKSLIDENIKQNDVAHKNFGVWPHKTARTSACCAPSRLLSRVLASCCNILGLVVF